MIPAHTTPSEIAAPGPAEPPSAGAAPLRDLVHDLRQPLGIIETCAYYLRMVLPSGDPRIDQQLDMIERQVFEADRILKNAVRPVQTMGGAADESFLRTKAESAGLT